jgi:NIMA-interacting peptidyl-prolyl cis-trans isomerase 1
MSVSESLKQDPPPDPLPNGWILRHSHSQPGNVYFYNQETGESVWEQPVAPPSPIVAEESVEPTTETAQPQQQQQEQQQEQLHVVKPKATDEKEEELKESKKRPAEKETPRKLSKTQKLAANAPKQVRVLHILKKHKDSRRPSSWRKKEITCTKEEAKEELQEILGILQESSSTPQELRATMEELARTESDCSSAKRGGDLGYFGKKKMQPAFEQASFALENGELSDIIETSSGVHIILRIG